MKTISYKDLVVWQKAMKLVEAVYELTRHLPKEEAYGLSSQIRRSAISIPSNIAEGYKRRNTKEYVQFLSIADASAAELETQIIVVSRIYKNIDCEKVFTLLLEVQKMLITMIKKLRQKNSER